MRRGPLTAVLGAVAAILLIAAGLSVAHQTHADAMGLQEVGIIDLSKTFSRIAADRPCPPLTADDELPPEVPNTLRLVTVGTAEEPTSVAFRPGHQGDGYLSERPGRVLRVTDGRVTDDVALDLRRTTISQGDGGLLALAIDPEGRWLYLERTENDLDDVIEAYPIRADGELDAGRRRVIVHSDHPSSVQHHGGSLAFDSHGFLYFGFGDGGGLGDPRENGQRPGTLLGKISRVRPTPDRARPYEVPDDNPFVGHDGFRPEIWVYGVRNPYRMTYDERTDSLWIGDVGQSCWDEIDHLRPEDAGSNLGWDVLEGTHRFEDGPLPTPALAPVFEVSHRHGWCAIVAGPVQRGDALPSLDGRLLVTDYCKGAIWSIDPDDPSDVVDTGLHAGNAVAIVAGPDGRPWVLTLDDRVLEIRDR